MQNSIGRATDNYNIHEIVPGLFLGNQWASSPDTLYQNNIDCVLNVGGAHTDMNKKKYKLLHHAIIEIDDTPNSAKQMLNEVIPYGVSFIDNCFKKQKKVLVHCAMGISRSSTIVIAWIMKNYGMNRVNATTLVKSVRNIINPNEGFIEALKSYDAFLQKVHQHRSVLRGATAGGGRSFNNGISPFKTNDNVKPNNNIKKNNNVKSNNNVNPQFKQFEEHFQVIPSNASFSTFSSTPDVSYFREHEERMYKSDDAFQHKY